LKYVSAWKAKDIPSLDRLIADDYMTLNGESKLANKQSELAEAKDDPPYDRMDVLEIHSLIRGNTAVVTGILQADGKSAGGKPFSAKARFLATLLKRNGQWQLVADQSSPSN
jgi:ketosteroid isomerase-like protein